MNNNELSQNIRKKFILDLHNETLNPKSAISQAQSTSNSRQNKALSNLLGKLDQLSPNTKVRIIFKDFHNYSNFLSYYQKYKNKFVLFKDKKEFLISDNSQKQGLNESVSFKKSLSDYLNKTKVDNAIKRILLEEIK